MLQTTVSVIMPTFNSSKFVSEAIMSVMSQTIKDWELIIVDDCSTDDTVDVVSEFLEDPRIKLNRLDINQGAAIARNTAIQHAKGRYIAFLDSDDQWLPNKLEEQLNFMQENQVDFCFSSYVQVDESGNHVGTISAPVSVSYKQLLKKNVIGCLTVIYDTKALGKVYMPLIRKRQDFGLWLRLLKKAGEARSVGCPLAKYRVHAGSISANKWSAAFYTWRLYRDVEKLPLHKALYYFSFYAVEGFFRPVFSFLLAK